MYFLLREHQFYFNTYDFVKNGHSLLSSASNMSLSVELHDIVMPLFKHFNLCVFRKYSFLFIVLLLYIDLLSL